MIETQLRAIAAGDRQAFAALFRAWQPRLVCFAAGILAGDRAAAEDVVDEAMLAVWQQAGRFNGVGSAEGWLRRIVRNKAVDWLRSHARHGPSSADPEFATTVEQVADDAPTPEQAAAAGSQAEALRRALARLSPDQREAVWLCYYEGRSLAEIADLCGCPENTVKTRLFHARRTLRGDPLVAGLV